MDKSVDKLLIMGITGIFRIFRPKPSVSRFSQLNPVLFTPGIPLRQHSIQQHIATRIIMPKKLVPAHAHFAREIPDAGCQSILHDPILAHLLQKNNTCT